jgi:hypothetical protein
MINVPALVHDGAFTAGLASLLYLGTASTAALVAILAPSARRRRAARAVLTILLRRSDRG